MKPLNERYDYVQGTEPANATLGETWLDTSGDSPVEQVYADLGNGGSWVREVVSDTVSSNLDAAVSSRSDHSDPDPDGNISNLDAEISSRSSHSDPDPDGHLDADVSSRSSHGDPDPDGKIDNLDAKVSEASSSGIADLDFRTRGNTTIVNESVTITDTESDSGTETLVSGGAYVHPNGNLRANAYSNNTYVSTKDATAKLLFNDEKVAEAFNGSRTVETDALFYVDELTVEWEYEFEEDEDGGYDGEVTIELQIDKGDNELWGVYY